jgi:hypothetical protein
MTTEATSFLGHREKAGTANHAFAGPNLLLRFRSFIESTDWDVITPARQRRLDRGCIALLAAATLYFLPILARICLQ